MKYVAAVPVFLCLLLLDILMLLGMLSVVVGLFLGAEGVIRNKFPVSVDFAKKVWG